MFQDDFQKELEENDALIAKEKIENSKSGKNKEDEYKEFAEFIQSNKVKVKKGGDNDSKK